MVKCSACGAPGAPAKCSKCLSTSYCNRTCQINDWDLHKKVCAAEAAAAKQAGNDSIYSAPATQQSAQPPKEGTDDAFSSPSKMCIARIHTDLKALARDPIEGIFVEADEDRINVCHAMILGPTDTPYEWGFFYFILEFPDQYPCVPPRVTLKTTGGGKVRFNPNLYACGKVCLSILGTWNGPSWSPAQNIGSVLLSIRSLLNSTPYFNEPGFENKPPQESRTYNHLIRHETIRVAVLDMASSDFLPPRLASVVQTSFFDFCEVYKYICEEYAFLDGRSFVDPLWPTNRGTFQFASLKARIEQMREDVETEGFSEETESKGYSEEMLTKEGDAKESLPPSATLATDDGSSSTTSG